MRWYEFEIFITDVEPKSYDIDIEGADELDFTIDSELGYITTAPYDGPYVIIPTPEDQILNTKDKNLVNDVTVKAIPSCYGLITQNGSVLIVS